MTIHVWKTITCLLLVGIDKRLQPKLKIKGGGNIGTDGGGGDRSVYSPGTPL